MSHRKAVILLVLSFFGYLLCYIPFCHLSNTTQLPPLSILPVSSFACLVTMLVVTWLCGWWKHLRLWTEEPEQATCGVHGTHELPTTRRRLHPAAWSSLFSVPILLGVPVSYALPGVSMFRMGVLMKSGSLATAPVADYWNGEPIRRSSWIAMSLCIAAIFSACIGAGGSWALTLPAAILFVLYIGGYLGRLRKMAGQKGSMQFFVTEHMLQPLAAFLVVCLAALVSQDVRDGFLLYRRWDLWGVGIFSQGIGLFGGWMLLYKRESSFSMPLNRAGAVIANLLANLAVHKVPSTPQLIGGGLVLGAIAALAAGDKEKSAK